jgi:hypothetical protein
VIATNQTVADEPPAGERKGAVRAAIIPCCLVKIPCSSGIISLLVRAGNYPRSRCGAAILGLGNVSERPKPLVSLQNSLLAGILRGDGCDQHCVASQADRVLENFLLWMRKPAKRGLFSSPIVSGDRRSNFLGREFPKVSSQIQENSRFLEIRPGDPRINPLHGRSGSVIATPKGGRCAAHRTRLGPRGRGAVMG